MVRFIAVLAATAALASPALAGIGLVAPRQAPVSAEGPRAAERPPQIRLAAEAGPCPARRAPRIAAR